VDKGSSKILGLHIIGPYAPELIQQVVNAMTSGGGMEKLGQGIHIHPALSELVQYTLNSLEECLLLEDSVNGGRAAKTAGMTVVNIATPFTNGSLHSEQIIEHAWIVHEPEKLVETVQRLIAKHNRTAQGS
jgi:phosphoglycolate phosphatase-like HAD superfamily hydrolase